MKAKLILILIFIAAQAFSDSISLRSDGSVDTKNWIREEVQQQLNEQLTEHKSRQLSETIPPSSERISDYLQYNKNVGSKDQQRIMLGWYGGSAVVFGLALRYVSTAGLAARLGELDPVKKYLWAATTGAVGLAWYQMPKWIYQECCATDSSNLVLKD